MTLTMSKNCSQLKETSGPDTPDNATELDSSLNGTTKETQEVPTFFQSIDAPSVLAQTETVSTCEYGVLQQHNCPKTRLRIAKTRECDRFGLPPRHDIPSSGKHTTLNRPLHEVDRSLWYDYTANTKLCQQFALR